jgi:hypothetical protein
MAWEVRFDPAFAAEAKKFARAVQLEIAALQRFGPQLRRPHCDALKGSKHVNMKELRFTLADGEWRIAFAFDPERRAILLVGGSESGVNQQHFYRDLIRVADARFTTHLSAIRPRGGGKK